VYFKENRRFTEIERPVHDWGLLRIVDAKRRREDADHDGRYFPPLENSPYTSVAVFLGPIDAVTRSWRSISRSVFMSAPDLRPPVRPA
jgi:hypothetical protein